MTQIEDILNQTKEFLSFQSIHRKIVLISSGGTKAPLERNVVRFLDNFSRGDRGALSAECFLAQGYSIIYLYRSGSAMPFTNSIRRVYSNYLDQNLLLGLQRNENGAISFAHKSALFLKELQVFQDCYKAKRILFLSFEDVYEYLELLEALAKLLSPLGSRVMFYLAAAVSDFYIPIDKMENHKIQSTSEGLSLFLYPVPKMLSKLTSDWATQSFVVSFKLETDPDLTIKKAQGAITKYGVDLVVANQLQTRKDIVYLIAKENINIPRIITRPSNDNFIEHELIDSICAAHCNFISELRNSKVTKADESDELTRSIKQYINMSIHGVKDNTQSNDHNETKKSYSNGFYVMLAIALVAGIQIGKSIR